jgi:[protein-PII] uridylyltransferase
MANTSQRRDLEDPSAVRTFAKQVQNSEVLSLLTIHTFADSLATSEKLWNDFKDMLLWSLYRKAMPLLTGGAEFLLVEEKQRELLAEEILRAIPGRLNEEEVRAHFATLPTRYFALRSAADILRELVMVHRFLHLQLNLDSNPLAPVVDWHNEPDRGYTVAKVCTWDRRGLFSNMTGSFSAVGLNILTAQVFTRADGIALDTFYVTDAKTGTLANRDERDKFEALLVKVLTGGEVDFRALIAKQKGVRPVFQAYEGDRMPTKIRFDNEASETRGIMEVETEDRIGLLYAISRSLAELDLDISAAKIVTEKGAAIDTFYISERDGRKVSDAGRQAFIQRKLRNEIQALA